MMKMDVASICDVGLRRRENQDSVMVYTDRTDEMALLVVADGVGGGADGARASHYITDEMREWAENFTQEQYDHDFNPMFLAIRKRITKINEEIYSNWIQKTYCGSTCVLLFFYQKTLGVFSVGDSRAYRGRGFGCCQLTRDDVWENQPDIKEKYTESERSVHPNRGKLMHSVGSSQKLVWEARTEPLKDGDIFALCSDGIYKMCSEKYLKRRILAAGILGSQRTAKAIMREVYKKGAKDNASIIIARWSDEPELSARRLNNGREES